MQSGSVLSLLPHERQQLEQQLQDLREAAYRVSKRLNAALTVVNLPEELLLNIFQWSILLCCPAPTHDAQPVTVICRVPSDTYGWIVATHVCQRWSLRFGIYRKNNVEAWKLVYEQSARIHSFCFLSYTWQRESIPYDELAPFITLNNPSFPLLKTLKVLKATGGDVIPPCRLMQFRYSSSGITNLEVSDFGLSVMNYICPTTLKHLVLRRFDHTRAITSISERHKILYDLLCSLVMLETLSLEDGLHYKSPLTYGQTSMQPVAPSITLPHLHSLHVLSLTPYQPMAGAKFVCSFDLPSLSQLRITSRCTNSDLEDMEARAIGVAAGQQLASMSARGGPIHSLCVKYENNLGEDLRPAIVGWSKRVGASFHRPLDILMNNLVSTPPALDIICLHFSLLCIIKGVVPYLPLEDVETLILDDYVETLTLDGFCELPFVSCVGSSGGVTRMEVLGQAENVRYLSVSGATAAELSALLCPEDDTSRPLFPKLRQVKLVGVAFNRVFVRLVHLTGKLPEQDWATEFVGALRARTSLDRSLRLEKLYIEDAEGVTSEMVTRLKECVDEVVWDGRGVTGT